MKTITFERAGMKLDDMNDVGTCRIRTAFHTKDGKALYLELIAIRKGKYTQDWCKWDRTGFVDGCYEMEGNEIAEGYISHEIEAEYSHFEWTLSGILNLVNSIGGDFDELIISDPEVYSVFKSTDGNYCNFGD